MGGIDHTLRGPYGVAKIELLPGAKALKEKPFRMVGARQEALQAKVDLFLSKGWIEPSHSEWAARAFAIPKAEADGWRVVID